MENNKRYSLPDDLLFGYVPSPGEIIRDELDARGWAQQDLANIMGRPLQAINEIINAKKEITTETAIELGAAFGTSADLWMNLEKDYRLWLEKQEAEKEETEKIRRRSRIYSLLPVRKVQKRGWIKRSKDLNQLEDEVCNFFDIQSIFSQPSLSVGNFRLSIERGAEEASVRAWVRRVEQIAEIINNETYIREHFDVMVENLLGFSTKVEDVAQIPRLLSSYGIKFIILEHLPKTYIDGGAFWLDGQPIVVVTLRYNRIDSFWFTLMHELGHIKFGHEGHVDDLQNPGSLSEMDQEANNWATEKLVDLTKFEKFILMNQPHYSKVALEEFASQIDRHPGIIVGQLQHREEISYASMREYLEKVRVHLQPWISN